MPDTDSAPGRDRVTHLTPRFTEAVAYAAALHATQLRKSTDVPYIAHLLGVASLVLEAEGDEDMAIAGLLHDAAEDQGGEARLHDIEARFGSRVALFVRSCSDSLAADPRQKEEYALRKSRYLAHLRQADRDTVTVATADKVHNARAIHTDLQNGIDVFARFNGTAEQILAYYDACIETARAAEVSASLVTPLITAVAGIRVELDG